MPERGMGPRVPAEGLSPDHQEISSQVPTRLEPAFGARDQLPPPEPNRVPPLRVQVEGAAPPPPPPDQKRPPPAIPGYQVLNELGHGGMGVVYQARQISLDRLVALKMIRSGEFASAHELTRFRTEAEAVARLKHPNIVQIYEVGECESRPYFSLEYVEGGSLAQSLNGVPQPVRPAAELVETLARAMHAAHQQGIVHRDLKPANVLLTVDRTPKITDFGLAKRLDTEAGQTMTGTVMGTPSYMAPEQAAGKIKEIGPASDVYSLGAILYELLTGRPPFLAESWEATREQVLTQEPVAPRRLQPKLPRDLQTICLKCLDKEPRKRYASALALAEELRCYLEGKPIRSRPVSAPERVWRWARRSPKLAAASGLAVAGAVAAVIVSINHMVYLTHALREAKTRSAESTFDSGLRLCEQGEAGQGVLLLARSLELAPADEANLQSAIRMNLAGWYRQVHPLKAILPHKSDVIAVAFNTDGKTVWTGCADGTAQLWDAATGEPIGPGISFQKEFVAMSFSPDRKTLITGSADGMAQLWNANTGEPIGPPLRHSEAVRAVAFSCDGRTFLTGGEDDNARLWNAETGQSIREPIENPGTVRAVALSSDRRTVLTGVEGEKGGAYLWDATARKPTGVGLVLEGDVVAAAFSPDGGKALVGGPNGAQLFDIATGKKVGLLRHQDGIQAVAFSPDGGKALTGSLDNTARLWDPITVNPIGSPLPHQATVLAVAFSPDGKRVVTGSADKTARIWELASTENLDFLLPHDDAVHCVAISPDMDLAVTGCGDGKARLWETATGKLRRTLIHGKDDRTEWVVAVAFRHDSKGILTGGVDGTAQLWDAATDKPLRAFKHKDRIWKVAFSPDDTSIITASSDKTAKLWDAATGNRLATLPHGREVHTAAYSPDGTMVATGSVDKTAQLWIVATGEPYRRPLQHDDSVEVVAFSPDGKLLLTGTAGKIAQLWDVATGERCGRPLEHLDMVFTAAFCPPDGKKVLTGSADKKARLWDAATGALLRTYSHQGPVRAVAFSPDGETVLTGSWDKTARLWQTISGKPLGPPFAHEHRVRAVAFGLDGKTILTGSIGGTARLSRAPAALEGTPERILLWTQLVTGMKVDGSGMVEVMDSQDWHRHRRSMED